MSETKSFWTTLPGILTGIAGIITAIGGLLVVLYQIQVIGPNRISGEIEPERQSLEETVRSEPEPMPEPEPEPGEQPTGIRVVEVFLRADPFDYVGPCPVTIKFSGRISVVGGSGIVSYKFLRSDGASAPIQTLTFDSPGSKDVSTTWRLGGPRFTYSGWQSIKIFEPQEIESNHAIFKIQCQEN